MTCFRYLILLIVFFSTTLLAKDVNSDLLVFKRCYGIFTSHSLPLNDPRVSEIKSKNKTAVELCLDLLDNAKLSLSSGELIKQDDETVRTLDTFHRLHSSWFAQSVITDNLRLVENYHDVTSPGAYFTKALFADQRFMQILTGQEELKTIRLSGGNTVNLNRSDITFATQDNNKEVEGVEIGNVIGIKSAQDYLVYNKDNEGNDISIKGNVYGHMGGGVIGSFAFNALNSGAYLGQVTSGGMHINRTLTKNIFKNFMCREIPVIRNGDQIKYLAAQGESKLPFRDGLQCMKCHASIDYMGIGFRNVQYKNLLGSRGDKDNYAISGLIKHEASLDPTDLEKWPEKEKNFHLKSPLGKLYYRNYNGDLVDEPFVGVPELGQLLSRQDDVYSCFTSKYVKFLTGIDIAIGDIGDINHPRMSSKELEYRSFIIKLSQRFKKHQSVKELIKEILSSNAFIKPGVGVE